jgi:hypothetical protein
MSLIRIGKSKGFAYFVIFVFLILISQQGIPAKGREEGPNDKPSYRQKKSAQVASSSAKENFEQLFGEAKRLYSEMNYEEAIKKLVQAKNLASTAMQKADLNLYLSLAYYATSGGQRNDELVSAIENVIIFDYLRELEPSLCPSGYIEIFQELKSGFGSLQIQSRPPGADIFLDKKSVGKTPLTIGAKPGSVNILVKLGKKEKKDQLKIAAGRETTSPIYDLAEKKRGFPIVLALAGAAVAAGVAVFAFKGGNGNGGDGNGGGTTGSIQVNSSPTGAKIFLDGSDTGKVTNTTLTDIAAGSHAIKLTKDGYTNSEQSVSVTAGQTAQVNITLAKDTITVTQPSGKTIWTFGGSVTITWQAGATLSGQPQFSVSGPTQASLLNQHRLNARYLRSSQLAAGMRTGRREGFDRSGRGRSLERLEGAQNFRGAQADISAIRSFRSDQSGATHPTPDLPIFPYQKAQTPNKAKVLDISNVKLELYKGNTLAEEIIPETENDGSHAWQVPSPLASGGGSDYKVRVSCASDTSIYGESEAFTIGFTTNYEFVIKWGSQGSGDRQFNGPWGVAVDSSGSVFAADTGNHRIQKFTSNGVFVTKWGSNGSEDGQFKSPVAIAVDASGYVYVTDAGNYRIQKFTSNGDFVTKWGSQGSEYGQFNSPWGIAVDASGYVYVADSLNHRIQKFTSIGDFVTEWGNSGSGNGQFNRPMGVAVDSSGSVFVADTYNHRIQKFDSSGVFVAKWGSKGTKKSQFSYPMAIAADIFGSVFVADTYNNRIQKFSSSRDFITQWGSQGSGNGQFKYPTGVAADISGYVYVADIQNYRIQKFIWTAVR